MVGQQVLAHNPKFKEAVDNEVLDNIEVLVEIGGHVIGKPCWYINVVTDSKLRTYFKTYGGHARIDSIRLTKHLNEVVPEYNTNFIHTCIATHPNSESNSLFSTCQTTSWPKFRLTPETRNGPESPVGGMQFRRQAYRSS